MIPEKWTMQDVYNIFNTRVATSPNGNNHEPYVRMYDLLLCGGIVVDEQSYSFVEPVTQREKKAYQVAYKPPGSQAHMELKWQAWRWLREHGEAEPKFEHIIPGQMCRADVSALGLGLVAECGNTEPSKVIGLLTSERCDGVLLFPFFHSIGPVVLRFQISPWYLRRVRKEDEEWRRQQEQDLLAGVRWAPKEHQGEFDLYKVMPTWQRPPLTNPTRLAQRIRARAM